VLWVAGFVAITAPFCWLWQCLLFLYWAKHKLWLYAGSSLLFVLFAFPIARATCSLHFFADDDYDFSVMSYNVRIFNLYDELNGGSWDLPRTTVAKTLNTDSDIVCLQEYYNDSKDDKKIFNIVQQFKQKGKKYFATDIKVVNQIGAQFGVAIFSKYPILKSGSINFNEKTKNGAVYADIRIGEKNIRVINIHLQSIYLRESDIDIDNSNTVLSRLKKGFKMRGKQVDAVQKIITESPYPVVLCGDFNDTPYSYSYFTIREKMQNAFEKAGLGFGFTYNGKLPFLRIDHQFFTDDLAIAKFKIDKSNTTTDHFPLKGYYQFKK
jgi:endonuclease/exonuclease/phosphatase family metal-dependent hydrolase